MTETNQNCVVWSCESRKGDEKSDGSELQFFRCKEEFFC